MRFYILVELKTKMCYNTCNIYTVRYFMNIKTFDFLCKEAFDIRISVFCDEQGFVDEIDDIDKVATHFVAFCEEMAVATCRVFKKDNNYFLGRFAVVSAYRKKGIGRALLTAAENFVKSKGFDTLSLHSQLRAKEFYEKCGYEAFGEIELEENYPHIWMKKKL